VDPREIPVYSTVEAARLVCVPPTSLRSWVGSDLIQMPRVSGHSRPALSFSNLVEAHVLTAIRRRHLVPLERIRKALRFMRERLGVPRPLITEKFKTDGVDLFVEYAGDLVNVSRSGQLEMRELIETYLARVDWDAEGIAARLYPLTRADAAVEQPRLIVIDPRRGFGRPVLAGTGVPVEAIASRYRAGDSIDALALDFCVPREMIEDALRLGYRPAA
jgi:uncharacterized protein (DUF433 family)